MMIEQLTRQDFTDLSPGDLGVEHEGGRLEMQVLEMRDLPPISSRRSPFAVELGGPPSPVLPQGIYSLLHPRHGRLDLFMVPIGRNAVQTRYELVFN
jgi:hypothetical protein